MRVHISEMWAHSTLKRKNARVSFETPSGLYRPYRPKSGAEIGATRERRIRKPRVGSPRRQLVGLPCPQNAASSPRAGTPDLERRVPRDVLEVVIGAEERQGVPDAKLGNQRIDGSHLNSCATTRVAQRGGLDVIITVRNQERHSGKPLENLGACLRSRETLQQLLENESGREDNLPVVEGVGEHGDLGDRLRCIPPQCQ